MKVFLKKMQKSFAGSKKSRTFALDLEILMFNPRKNTLARRKMKAFLAVVDEISQQKRKEGVKLAMDELYLLASQHEAPCYFVNIDFAARQIVRILQKKPPTVRKPYKQQMYYDIYDEYVKYFKNGVPRKTNWGILSRVINGRAKSFYLNMGTIHQLINIYYRG